ncbi:MAG TPA: PfkB family carbohydrate kinase [Candidatus Saccharimonadales bacterium]|nr:PfkB family carbohydrate kinase [Candidatus Saccharimonadales bacterium]
MQQPNIVLVGHVCIDTNTTENATYTAWGSSVLYVAQYYRAQYGIEPAIITEYGPDLLPYVPHAHFLPAVPNRPETLRYENDTRSVPRIWRCHNTEFAGPPELTPAAIEAIKAADIIVVATLLPNYSAAYIAQLMQHARPDALKLLCPQGYFRKIAADGLVQQREFTEASTVLPLFDVVVYSEEDHARALALARTWSQKMSTQFIVTQGEKGASIVARNVVRAIPTTPLAPEQIVDSVGCGDTFAATVAYQYFQNHDLVEAVQAAHRAAAAKLLAAPAARS